jgi:CMP-N-acetylneuraminic acid synthetase
VIDVTRTSTIFNKKSMTGDRILPYIMNPDDVIDIDRRQDVEIAELFFKNKSTK